MNKRILVTGAFGQIGSELVPALQQQYGQDQVVAVGHKNIPGEFKGRVEQWEVSDKEGLLTLIQKHDIGTVYHLVSLLSVGGEVNPPVTWQINVEGLRQVLDAAMEHKLRVFWPSSIAAFGPTTPRDNTPQRTVLEPTTIYGVTKVTGELLCQYYFLKYGLDVRSVRYPGIISWKTPPGGGTTDFAVAIFYEGLKTGKYTCFVKADTVLPMMYMDDAIRGTLQLMEADPMQLTVRTSYNLAAMSFSAQELAEEIKKHIPLQVSYAPDQRQKIADSWPKSIDDAVARSDWGWQPVYDLSKMTQVMLENLKQKFAQEK